MKPIQRILIACLMLSVAAVAGAQEPQPAQRGRVERPTPAPRSEPVALAQPEKETSRQVRGYSIVLLLAETQGNAVPDDLSPPARKALADIKDFLPYKSYRVLDTQWLAGADGGTNGSGHLLWDKQEYFFSLQASQYNQKFRLSPPVGPPLIDIGFTMRVGETVVVGTSRLNESNALVVLLTIVPK